MLLSILFGLVLLVVGAEGLVRGAARLAGAVGISPLVIGLTVVAFGTSAPELAVSVRSSLSGSTGLAMGNVVGSNIFNVLFILGLAAVITPLVVAQQLVRRDVPLMIGLSLLVWGFAADGSLATWEGVVLLVGLLAYTVWCIRASRRESKAVAAEYADAHSAPTRRTWPLDLALIVGGLALLVLGAQQLVDGAVAMAEWLGASEAVIGLTIVAAGTSMPEVATSVMASVRGQRDIAVGNVVGSNLFNLMGVLGVSATLSPGSGLPVGDGVLAFDLPVMVVVAAACLPVFFTGHRIARWEGALFLGFFGLYTLYQVLVTTLHPAAADLRWALAAIALPLVAVTLGVCCWRASRARAGGEDVAAD